MLSLGDYLYEDKIGRNTMLNKKHACLLYFDKVYDLKKNETVFLLKIDQGSLSSFCEKNCMAGKTPPRPPGGEEGGEEGSTWVLKGS